MESFKTVCLCKDFEIISQARTHNEDRFTCQTRKIERAGKSLNLKFIGVYITTPSLDDT